MAKWKRSSSIHPENPNEQPLQPGHGSVDIQFSVIEKKQHQQQEGKKYANPFTYDTPIDTYEKIKIFWMCLLGIPLLRFILLVIIFFFILFFGRLGVFGWNPFNHTNPTQKRQRLPKWRRFLLGPLPFLIRMALFVIGFYSIPVKFPKSKSDTLRKLPRIIISNHISFLDGFFFAFFCFPSIAMKKELQEIPLIGRIFLAFEAIFIDRSSAEGRKKAFQDIQDQLNDSFFPPLLIFPEGTTSNQKFLTQFKVGSFGSGFSCQPVVIRYPFQHFDVSWTPSISALHLGCRLLCQVYSCMEVEFLPVYVPNDEEKSNPALYAHNVRQVMAKAMGVACTNHAYEDVALLMQNEFLRQYTNDHIILTTNVTEISSLTCLYGQDVEKLIHFFIQRDRNLDGHLSFDEFVHLFPNDSKLLLHHLFHLLDLDGNGLIDFREFCLAIGMLSRPTIPHDPTTTGSGILHTYRPMTTTGINSSSNIDDQEENQMIDFAFRLYDLNENGSLEVKELEKMLDFVFTFHSTSLIEKTNPQQILASLLIEEEEQEHHQPSTTAASTTGTAATSGTTATSSITSTTTRQISYQTFKKCIQKRPYLLSGPIQRLELLRGFQPVDIKKPHRNTIIT